MFFPNGLAGLWDDYGHHITNKFSFIKKTFAKKTSLEKTNTQANKI
jgi:urea transport system permease protein